MTEQQFALLLEALEGIRLEVEEVKDELRRANVAEFGADLGDLP